jgi:hypothetical protein
LQAFLQRFPLILIHASIRLSREALSILVLAHVLIAARDWTRDHKGVPVAAARFGLYCTNQYVHESKC